MYITVKATVVK